MATLTTADVERYKRHLVLKDIGAPGQQRLKSARVLIVGAGGLGCPSGLYLAAAGVGTLGIVDDDVVSIDNLQRQIAYTTSDAGRGKVDALADAVGRLNPGTRVETHATRLNPDNALQLIAGYDIVVDGTDNFASRYLIADACHFAQKPLVYGALGSFDGYLTVFKSYELTAVGEPLPSLRCIFPEPPPGGLVANCAEVGVLGPVAGVIGTLQATETIKEIVGLEPSLAGRLVIYDALGTRFESIRVSWNPDNPLTGKTATITDLSVHRVTDAGSCADRTPETGAIKADGSRTGAERKCSSE